MSECPCTCAPITVPQGERCYYAVLTRRDEEGSARRAFLAVRVEGWRGDGQPVILNSRTGALEPLALHAEDTHNIIGVWPGGPRVAVSHARSRLRARNGEEQFFRVEYDEPDDRRGRG